MRSGKIARTAEIQQYAWLTGGKFNVPLYKDATVQYRLKFDRMSIGVDYWSRSLWRSVSNALVSCKSFVSKPLVTQNLDIGQQG
jgi:hypothetical protein